MRKNRTAIKNFKYLGIFLLISLLFIQTLSSSLDTLGEDNLFKQECIKEENGHINSDIDSYNPISQDKTNLLQYPFFNNLTGIRRWISQDLVNNQSEGNFKGYLSETNRSGEKLVDNKVYFEETAVAFDGLLEVLGVPDINSKIGYFNVLDQSESWDPDEEGFYTWVDENYSDNSTIKELNGNAQPIITFADYMITET